MKPPSTKKLSNCCREPISVVGSDEGIMYYRCSFCLKPCDPVVSGKSFFDYSSRKKKRVVGAATRESNRAQRELMEKNQPKEAWEEKFRIAMAGIIGREGKFAMNSMVALVHSLLSHQKQTIRHDLTKIFEKYSIEVMTGNVVLLELDVYFDTLSDAAREEKEEDEKKNNV